MNVPLGNRGLERSPATPKRISPKIGRVVSEVVPASSVLAFIPGLPWRNNWSLP
jgi:hypothetical protein